MAVLRTTSLAMERNIQKVPVVRKWGAQSRRQAAGANVCIWTYNGRAPAGGRMEETFHVMDYD